MTRTATRRQQIEERLQRRTTEKSWSPDAPKPSSHRRDDTAQSLTTRRQTEERLNKLEAHLAKENPVLLQVVRSFRELDRVAYRLGFLNDNDSYATRVPWWPMISLLGTYSAGKSSFLNHYLGIRLQLTGNQAVDDKFTVVCYSSDNVPRVLPGLALDADPRFPFYQISKAIEGVESGEGRRVDAYLQLKTCSSARLKGKIFIDSPGFDADDQRTATLRITDHIIALSDLALVLFDARHPEPGAMQDTLQHLVAETITRPDSNKFLYILNQMDTSAREDNPEKVFAAWQRALAEYGLTAGRFYCIYNPDLALPIEDEALRARFEEKRDADMAVIYDRIHQVEVERAYRIIGVLEKTAKTIEQDLVPQLRATKSMWRRRVLALDSIIFGLTAVGLIGLSIVFPLGWLLITGEPILALASFAAAYGIALYLHSLVKKIAARTVVRKLQMIKEFDARAALINAFRKNTRFGSTAFSTNPSGWGQGARKRLSKVLADADRYVQALNDQFTDPSGTEVQPEEKEAKLLSIKSSKK